MKKNNSYPAWLIIALLLASFSTGHARESWEGSLNDRFFQTFIKIYKEDPSALARFAGGLRNVSSAQMDATIEALGVTHFTYLHPMILHGYELPDIRGKNNRQLSLMAPRGPHGKMIPIPFQIDEFDKTGLIWIPGFNKAKPEGVPETWDDFDQLVFMFRDGSDHRYDAARDGTIAGHVLKEIELKPGTGKTRWVYLVEGNPERSDADYVSTNLKTGEVDSTLYSFRYDPSNVINIQSIAPKAGPHYDVNTFGGFDLTISTGLLNRHLRVSLGRSNIHATPLAVKDGPIRNILLVKSRVWYLGLPTLFDQQFMLDFYEQGITVPSRFALDSMRTLRFFVMFLREPTIDFQVRFKNLAGASITFADAFSQGQYGTIDGHMSDYEKKLAAMRLPGDWIFLDSNQGWQMFFANRVPVVPNGLFDHFLDGMSMHMVYADTLKKDAQGTMQPELALGFASSGLPRTAIALMASLPKLDFRNLNTLGEAIIELGKAGADGKLKKYDGIVNTRMTALMQAGVIKSVPQFADLFIKDLDRMSFTGIARADFNALMRDAIVQTVKQPNTIDHGAVLRRLVSLAAERHLDIRNLRYAFMDNAVWLPDWVGPGGPEDFNQQLEHPPTFSVRPFASAGTTATP